MDEKTIECVSSIRKLLPDAVIILSTWNNQDYSQISVDTLCALKDPGADKIKNLGNISREVYGRKKGLEECKREFTLIIRSDSKNVNLNFIEAYERGLNLQFGKHIEYKTLKSRVIMCSVNRFENALFFMNDWFFFGLTEDLKKIFDVEIVDTKYIECETLPMYCSPHEYLALNFCSKYFNVAYSYDDFCVPKYRDMWEKIIVENFIMIGFYENYGIVNLKEPYYKNQIRNSKFGLSGIKHLMMNYEYEDWYGSYMKLYGEKVKCHKRLNYLVANILIRLYRKIKPKYC